jgi:hypothetical protein
MERQLIHNSVKCLDCGVTLVSSSVHDYKTCLCPNETMVDGGVEYERYGGKNLTRVESKSLYSDSPHELIRDVIERGSRGKYGRSKLKYIKLKNIKDDHLEAIIQYEQKHRPNNKFLPIYLAEKEYRKTMETGDTKILYDIYRDMYANSEPKGDFDELLKNAAINERGEKDIPFLDYEIAEEKVEEIFIKHLRGKKITKLKQHCFRQAVILGCSPKIKINID